MLIASLCASLLITYFVPDIGRKWSLLSAEFNQGADEQASPANNVELGINQWSVCNAVALSDRLEAVVPGECAGEKDGLCKCCLSFRSRKKQTW